MSRRRLVAGVVALGVVLSAAAAQAAFQGKLHGAASVNALSIAWSSPGTAGSNDEGTANDPSSPGMSPTRETYNVGSTTVTAPTTATLNISVSGGYNGYRATVTDLASVTGGGAAAFKIQGVTLSGTPAGTTITAGLDPALCGAALTSTAAAVTFEVKLVDISAAPSSFTLNADVNIVPAAAFVAGSCVPWS